MVAPQKQTLAYRGALVAVILLGILIAIALALVVAGMVMRMRGPSRRSAAEPAQFTLAPDQRIEAAQVTGDRLVLRLIGPEGDEIDIVDLETGRLVAKIGSAPSAPK